MGFHRANHEPLLMSHCVHGNPHQTSCQDQQDRWISSVFCPQSMRDSEVPGATASRLRGESSVNHRSNWHLNRVQQCKFGGHAQHTVAPYVFVDGTGAFPHSDCSSTASRARIRDGGLRLTTELAVQPRRAPRFCRQLFLAGLWSSSACVACACPRVGQGHRSSA